MKRFSFILLMTLNVVLTFAQPSPLKDANGKYGYVDAEGNWVIPSQYDEASIFDDLSFAFAKQNGKWGVIDLTGKIIQPFEFSQALIGEYLFGDDQSVAVVKNNKYGIVSLATGKMLTECVYEKGFSFTDGIIPKLGNLSVVYRNKKAGLLNEYGVEVVPCEYDGGKKPFTNLDYDLFVLANKNGKAGVIDTAGHELLACQFDEIKISVGMDETFEVKKDGKFGLYTFSGKEMIKPLYEKRFFFEGEYSVVKYNGKFGVINRKGEAVVPFNFAKEAEAFEKMLRLYDK